MSSTCRPVLWAALFALALPLLADKSCCVALTPPQKSSQTTVEDGSNSVTDDTHAKKTDSESNFSDGFFQCYRESRDSALSCIGEGAKTGLSSFFSKENLELSDGLSLVREAKESEKDAEGREVPINDSNFGHDPAQAKTVIESAAAYLSSRAIRWDMSTLYPGLTMRIGPTLGGSGVLEFVLEPRRYYSDRALGPSRVVLKQVILPFLLGLKVSVASLVPLLLFTVVFLAKKALLMTQLSALLSGVLGFGAMGFQGHGHGFGGGFAGAASFLGEPVIPVRTSHQLFSGHPVDDGPVVLHSPAAAVGSPWAGPLPHHLPHHPHHLFRGVNYDVRDERHANGYAPVRGFRWEDKDSNKDRDERERDRQLRRTGSFSRG